MTEQASTPEVNQEPVFQIQRVYLKDASLEQPNAPQILLMQGEPQVQIQMDIQFGQLQDGIFEVSVIGQVTTKVEDKVLFLVEAKQSGIFEIRNLPQENIEPTLAITCPMILYPYLRSNIADLVGRAGFQPIHMAEVNFHALYEQRLAQAHAGNLTASTQSTSLPN